MKTLNLLIRLCNKLQSGVSKVAPICTRLYRRFVIGRLSALEKRVGIGWERCRLQTCDTADCKSALRNTVAYSSILSVSRIAGLVIALVLMVPATWAQRAPNTTDTVPRRDIEKLAYPKLNDIKLPEIVRHTLSNGLRLILVEDHELPQIEWRILVRGGAIAEPKDKAGLTELFGEVHRTGGTKSMSGDQVDEFLERLGAAVEAGVGEAFGQVSGRALVEHFDKVLPIFSAFLREPAFAQEKIDLAKTHMRSGIARRNDNVQQIARRELRKLIYGADSTYARQYEYDDVDVLERADLRAFYDKYYRPDGAILVIWGDFNAEAMKGRLADTFGSWRSEGAKTEVTPPQFPPLSGSVNYIEKKDIEQTYIVMGHLGLRWDDPDYPAIYLLSDILGGGFSSRLFVNVRTTKGLAYQAGGWMAAAYDHPGLFSFYTSTKPATTSQALGAMLEEIRKIRQGLVTDAELRRAKEGYLNSYAFEYDSIAKIVNRMAIYEFYGYPSDFNVKLRDAIEKVTKEDILRVAQQHLKPDALTILAVGNREQFDQPLSTFGPVKNLDIKIPEPKSKVAATDATAESMNAGTALLIKAAKAAGEPALLKLKDITSEGVTKVKSPMGEMELKGTSLFVLPDRLRVDITTPRGTMVRVLDGEKAWVKMGDQVRDVPESALKDLRHSLYTEAGGVLLLKQALEGKLQAQALGKKSFEGKEAEAVLIRLPDSILTTYIAPEDATVLGFTYDTQTAEGPKEVNELQSAFQVIEGLRMPMEGSQKAKDEVLASSKATSIKINQGFDEERFKKPSAPIAK